MEIFPLRKHHFFLLLKNPILVIYEIYICELEDLYKKILEMHHRDCLFLNFFLELRKMDIEFCFLSCILFEGDFLLLVLLRLGINFFLLLVLKILDLFDVFVKFRRVFNLGQNAFRNIK